MKRFWQWALILGAVGLTFLGWPQLSHADSVGYTVNAVLPKNQDDSSATYFALRVKPKQHEKLTVAITNQTKKSQRFQVNVNQAVTSDNGVIDYSQTNPQLDSSLKVSIKDVFGAKKVPTVTVPAKQTKDVSIHLTMPAKRINGMILGGINVRKLGKDADKSSKGVSLTNSFAYVIGVRLREAAVDVAPNLNLLSVEAGQRNSLNQVNAKLQNPEPGIMSNLKIKTQVTKLNSSKILLQNTKGNLAMAPNSHFTYSLPWGNTQLKAGQYTMTLDATAKGGYHWHFVRNFTVTQQQLKQFANRYNQPQAPSYFWWFLAGGLIILLLLAIIGFLLWKNHRDKDQTSRDTSEPTDKQK